VAPNLVRLVLPRQEGDGLDNGRLHNLLVREACRDEVSGDAGAEQPARDSQPHVTAHGASLVVFVRMSPRALTTW
jgi:hypothetical protein